MIEGTRHERAALVTTAYVIGFITAFIGFGVSYLSVDTGVPVATQPASVVMTTETESTSSATPTVSLEQTADGLFLNTDEGVTLLASFTSGDVATTDGEYVALAATDVSPNGSYAYFCEVPSVSSDNCAPYVYNVMTERVYPVTINGNRVAFSAEPHTVIWAETGPLSIAGEVVDQLPQ